MAEESTTSEKPKKSGKGALIAGLGLALVLGGGGFYAVYAGYLLGDKSADAHVEAKATAENLPPVSFVPI